MEAILGPVIDKLVNKLISSLSTRLDYVWNYGSNIENLGKELGELEIKKCEIENSVEEAENNGHVIKEHVKEWLVNADNMIKEVTNFVRENEKAEMKCFKNLCPDLKKHYRLGKNAAEKIKNVSEWRGKQLQPISHRPIPQGMSQLSTEFMDDLECRMTALNDVISALKDENMIGIYGMGGVGKTTLAKRVGQIVKRKQLFDFTVFVEVKEQPNVQEIQNTIAGMLNLNLDDRSDPRPRDTKLYEILEKKKKVLIILDNIWNGIDLTKIGVPLADGDKGCHLLLITRDINVLTQMNCQKKFPIEALGKEDSWKLFEETAGSCVQLDDINSVARNVADRCGGLPVAIVTVAKALKDKPLNVWEAALREFHQSAESSVIEKAHLCIQLSYEHLNSNGLKSIFLLCCIFSRVSKPSIENLLRYGLVLNIFEPAETMEDKRDYIRKVIRDLVNRSLLLESSDEEFFSIHDLVREFGVRTKIMAQEQELLVVHNILRPSMQRTLLQNLTWVFLIDMSTLPNKFNCPNLTFFYLKTKSNIPLPHDFFSGMPKLEVIHLEGLNLVELPNSLVFLVELGALFMKKCKLGDISIIGELKNLEILVLFDCGPEEKIMPESIGNLSWLRLLDLGESKFIIPSIVISKLTLLEGLYMDTWYNQQVDSLKMLKELHQLTALQIRVEDADVEVFSKSVAFQNLKRYNLVIGGISYTILRDNWRALQIPSRMGICLEGVIKQLNGIEILYLEGKSIMQSSLYRVDEIGFPNLKRLYLDGLVNVENICDDQVMPQSLCQLKKVYIWRCHNLKNLFPLSIVNHLPVLEVIEVRDCENINEIFIIDDDREKNGVIDRISFKKLNSMVLLMLSKLTRICTEMKATVNASSNDEMIEFSHLTDLVLVDVNVKRISPSHVPNLSKLKIDNCHSLEYIFSSSTVWRMKNLRDLSISNNKALEVWININDGGGYIELPSLESLTIRDCPRLRELIGRRQRREGGIRSARTFSFPQLKFLSLTNLPHLSHLYGDEYFVEWKKLKTLEVCNCQDVVDLFDYQIHFTTSISQTFTCLENLILNPKHFGMIRWNSFVECKQFFPRLRCLHVQTIGHISWYIWGYPGESFIKYAEFFPDGILEKFCFLEKLILQDCLNEEIFLCGEMEENAFWLCKEMEVSWCHKFKILMPPQSLPFSVLKILKVDHCSEMISVISISSAKSLMVLEELSITYCKKVAQIIDDQEDVVEGDITWGKLKTLEFGSLHNLMNFYRGNYIFNFPLLEKISVYNCPSLMLFSSGAFKMPKLQKLEKYRISYNCKDHELNGLIAGE